MGGEGYSWSVLTASVLSSEHVEQKQFGGAYFLVVA